MVWFLMDDVHALLCFANNRHGVTIATHAIERHFLVWMTTVRQPTKRRRSSVLTLKYTVICVYWWTRQKIHNTLIVEDRYLRLMGDKIVLSPIRRSYRSTTSRCSGFLLPRVRGFWYGFVSVCSLTYCNGNFRFTRVSELLIVIL